MICGGGKAMRTSRFYTKIYNILLDLNRDSYIQRGIVFAVGEIRKYKISKTKDYQKMPLVKTFIEGRKIIVPLSHNLAFYKKKYKNYDKHIIAVCNYVKEQKGYYNFIDVGANVGDTIINIGIVDKAKYLLIEGGEYYISLMKRNLKNYKYDYKLVDCFLSDEYSDDGYEIRYRSGTASLVKDQNQHNKKTFTLDEVVSKEKFEPNILKIDTDGFDFKVLRGSKNTLKEYKPVIFFEWWSEYLVKNEEEPISIFKLLYEMGYKEGLLFDNYGTPILVIETKDTMNLELLEQYSRNREKQICHYDVLLFHESDILCVNDFLRKMYKY